MSVSRNKLAQLLAGAFVISLACRVFLAFGYRHGHAVWPWLRKAPGVLRTIVEAIASLGFVPELVVPVIMGLAADRLFNKPLPAAVDLAIAMVAGYATYLIPARFYVDLYNYRFGTQAEQDLVYTILAGTGAAAALALARVMLKRAPRPSEDVVW